MLELGVATGDMYVVVDSDTYIEPNGIDELVTKLWSDEKYAAVCGYITPENHKESFIGKLQHYEHISFYGAIRAAQDKLGYVPVLAGAFVAHRASAVKKLGGAGASGWSKISRGAGRQYQTAIEQATRLKQRQPLSALRMLRACLINADVGLEDE